METGEALDEIQIGRMAWRLGREMQRTGTVGPDYVLEVHVFLDFGKAMSLFYHGSLNISFDLRYACVISLPLGEKIFLWSQTHANLLTL